MQGPGTWPLVRAPQEPRAKPHATSCKSGRRGGGLVQGPGHAPSPPLARACASTSLPPSFLPPPPPSCGGTRGHGGLKIAAAPLPPPPAVSRRGERGGASPGRLVSSRRGRGLARTPGGEAPPPLGRGRGGDAGRTCSPARCLRGGAWWSSRPRPPGFLSSHWLAPGRGGGVPIGWGWVSPGVAPSAGLGSSQRHPVLVPVTPRSNTP